MLDVRGGSSDDGTLIQEYDFLGGANQKWRIVPAGADNYFIQSLATGKVLDDPFGSTQAGTTIQQWDDLNGANQQWYVNDVNDPFYQIVNSQSALSLDVTGTGDGTLLQQDQFTGDVNQQWRLMVDGSLPVSSSGSDPAPPSVIGISSIAYIDETNISTYSATEVDYETAAYYDSYVASCLYQDGSQISCGSQTSSPGASAAGGYLNVAITAGSHYQLQTDHYLVAPFAYVSAGVNYYYNPYGYGYASDGGYSIDDSAYWSVGAAVYVGYADVFLGSTGLDAYTPLTTYNRGDLNSAVVDLESNNDGTYGVTLTGPGYTTLSADGLISPGAINSLPYCPDIDPVCDIWNGVKVYVRYGPVIGAALWKLWVIWSQKVQSPVGWPGSDPKACPAGWRPDTTPQGKPICISPDGTKSLSPHLTDADHAPHWDYNDRWRKPKGWRVWPDGTMTPK